MDIRRRILRKIVERMVNGVMADGFYANFNLNPEDWDEAAWRMLKGLFGRWT